MRLVQWIRQSVFRQLNFWISVALLLIFLPLGLLTYYHFYDLLIKQEQAHLSYRTGNIRDYLSLTVQQFQVDTEALYFDLNPNSNGISDYMQPENIPSKENAEAIFQQNRSITRFLNSIVKKKPTALNALIYRIPDGKLFQYGQRMYPNDMYLTPFFHSLPRTYDFPFIGLLPPQIASSHQPFIYIISPIYDFTAIQNKNIRGYLMLTLDPKLLDRTFQLDAEKDFRLVVSYRGQVIMDSGTAALPEKPVTLGSNSLVSSLAIKEYHLKVEGIKDKAQIEKEIHNVLLLIIVILIASWLIGISLILKVQSLFTRRLSQLVAHFRKLTSDPDIEPITVKGTDEISFLITRFNQMTVQLKEYIERNSIMAVQKNNAEYYALKMQINPHFLYNTLESLRMQAVIREQHELGEKLHNLGRLFRWVLKADDDRVEITEELRYTGYYLELFNLGKSNPIQLDVVNDLESERCHVLKFSFQPIIENAIIHGKLRSVPEPVIRIRIFVDSGRLNVEIRNNGEGISEENRATLQDRLESTQDMQKVSEHLGLTNVHNRIRFYYGLQYGIRIMSLRPDEGFGIQMQLPLHELTQGDSIP